ncbi:haloacid dehalogenase I [Salinisphaera dokdonensis CL-ES53]|uniref:(S)-2-haloacid dehalogenase n=1 Tax=Salinisphaera dokdonensis CL-ES53 TaxID=1304272 RepID=A0ABV2AWN4_9GAMM
MHTPLLVFDVNETLLDLAPLDACFADVFGDADTRKQWFASLLHWSTVTTLTGEFLDFSELAAACLDTLARQRGETLNAADKQTIFDAITTLAPHPEVPAALERLQSNGFTLVALTNSAQKTVDAQFENAGLTPLFKHVLSVDQAQHYKPHPSAYAVAANALDCEPAAMRLIAAHDWDVTGAMRAGCQAAFVARGGAVMNHAGEIPDVVGADLSEVAERLIAASDD